MDIETTATEEKVSETACEEIAENVQATTVEATDEKETSQTEQETTESDDEEDSTAEDTSETSSFKLTLPQNIDELMQNMCAKRGRKLLYKENETLYQKTFEIEGLHDNNEEGINSFSIIEAEIAEGLKLGYLAKFDGLKTSEIKEEYENDSVFELAGQELRKMGIIEKDGVLKVYVYDWDKKGCHHVGNVKAEDATDAIKYFSDKEKYSFNLCGIITGGPSKKVVKDEKGKIKIIKEKGEPLNVELDVAIINRKD